MTRARHPRHASRILSSFFEDSACVRVEGTTEKITSKKAVKKALAKKRLCNALSG